jgi:tyrosine-protein kinase
MTETPTSTRGGALPPEQPAGWAALRRFGWIAVALALVAAAAVLTWSLQQRSTYSASATVLVGQATAGAPSNGDVVSESEVASQRIVATSEPVLRAAAKAVGDTTVDDLDAAVSVQPVANTRVLTVTARASSPSSAAAWANAVADAYAAERSAQVAAANQSTREALTEQSAQITAQLEKVNRKLGAKHKSGGAVLATRQRLLQAQLASLATELRDTTALNPTSAAQVLNEAARPGSPVAPNPLRDTALGALFGLLVGIALALVAGQIWPEPRVRATSADRETRTSVADGLGNGIAGRELGEEV